MVTHSTAAASRAKRVLFIKDGILYNQIYRGERTSQEMFQLISDTLTLMANRGEQYYVWTMLSIGANQSKKELSSLLPIRNNDHCFHSHFLYICIISFSS